MTQTFPSFCKKPSSLRGILPQAGSFCLRIALTLLILFTLTKNTSAAPPAGDAGRSQWVDTVQSISRTGELNLQSSKIAVLQNIVLPSVLTGNSADDQDAITHLQDWLRGQEVILYSQGPPQARDRYGRLVVRAERRPDRLEIISALLHDGLAVVYGAEDQPSSTLEPLLHAEDQAREEQRGLWAQPRLLDPAQVAASSSHLLIIEGLVTSASVSKSGAGYLNFGADWRTDTTFGLSAAQVQQLERQGVPLASLKGRMVRGRGWVRSYNGPFLDITPLSHLEILPP